MAQKIVEISSNQLFRVRDAGPGLNHVWIGVPVKRLRGGFVDKKGAERLVRKAASIILSEAP